MIAVPTCRVRITRGTVSILSLTQDGPGHRLCLEAYCRALEAGHPVALADHLVALAYHRLDLSRESDLWHRLLSQLKPEASSDYDPETDIGVTRHLAQLRS